MKKEITMTFIVDEIPEDELVKSGFEDTLEFYIDIMYTDPLQILHGAEWYIDDIVMGNDHSSLPVEQETVG